MRRQIFLLFSLFFLLGFKGKKEIRVLTDRTASHLQGIFKEFEAQTGVKVVTNYPNMAVKLRRLRRRYKAIPKTQI